VIAIENVRPVRVIVAIVLCAAVAAVIVSPSVSAVGKVSSASAAATVRVTKRPGRVSPGDKASVTVLVSPKARCTIGFYYSTTRSRAHGLGAKTAKKITWTWEIGSNTKAGTWPVKIDCGKSGKAQTSVTVRPKTETFKLFNGVTVQIRPGCLDGRGTDETKKQAIAAANRLPLLKQKALAAERDLTVQERKAQRFVDQHPESKLPAQEYATYQSLKATYNRLLAKYTLAEKRYNQQTDTFNQLADEYNADLEACKLG
jgi:hypothetical protein